MIEMLCLVSGGVLAVYLVYTALRYGLGDYVSENFYRAREKWLFSVVMTLVAICLLPAMIEKRESLGMLSLLCAFGLLLVASEPYYKTRGRLVHNVGAYLAMVSGLVWVACFRWYLVVGAIGLFGLWCACALPKRFYVGEVLVFGLIYLNLLL